MKKLATIIVAIIAILMMACNSQKNRPATEAEGTPKYLVLYYSQDGTTKAVAEQLQLLLGADIEQFDAAKPYAGTYDETIERCLQERENQSVPTINPLTSNIADYDVVFLGYPIWFGTYASPVMGLLEVEDFAGKTVVPFCTFGSGGLESSATDLRSALPKAEIAEGYGVRRARIDAMPAEVERFLIEGGYMEGTVEPLPEFSAVQPVTADEAAIFNAACGDYQFPLGAPIDYAKREVAGATEYRFTAINITPDGQESQSTIYVLAAPDAKPVFTKVVR